MHYSCNTCTMYIYRPTGLCHTMDVIVCLSRLVRDFRPTENKIGPIENNLRPSENKIGPIKNTFRPIEKKLAVLRIT